MKLMKLMVLVLMAVCLSVVLCMGAAGCVEEDEDDGNVIWECEVGCDYEDDDAYYESGDDFEACGVNDVDELQDEIDDAIDDVVADLEDDGYYNISCSCSCATDGESC